MHISYVRCLPRVARPLEGAAQREAAQREATTTQCTTDYTYVSSKVWNTIIKALFKDVALIDIKIGGFKAKLKHCLLDMQSKFDDIEWYTGNLNVNQLSCDS